MKATERNTTWVLQRLRRLYRYHMPADRLEVVGKRLRERVFGVDLSIFDTTIAFYDEVKAQRFSRRQALERALDKRRHKEEWNARPRETIEAITEFYSEVDVYPFRQPYLKRFGGFRWYRALVAHERRPHMLEYGCGSAVLAEYWQRHFPEARVSVADIPSTTLDFVKWKVATRNVRLDVLTIGPGREGIPLSSQYDVIVCQDVLEHTPNPLDIVEAFCDRLAPGGALVVDFLLEPGGENLPTAARQREDVKQLLKIRLVPAKAIDEPSGNRGLYFKQPYGR